MNKKNTYQLSRRGFLKIGAMASLPIYLGGMAACSTNRNKKSRNFDIAIESNFPAGHHIMESLNWPVHKTLTTKTMVAGGGLAGLSAAASLADNDYLLFELGPNFGGTSSASNECGMAFTQGAHYDLAYPEYYGVDVIKLLSELQIVQFNNLNNTWEFNDKRFLIPSEWENLVVVNNTERGSILPALPQTDQFANLLDPYMGKMMMPVRHMDSALFQLDKVSFTSYLQENLGELNPELKQAIDHQMSDDYGSNADNVSALAGIHYYTCRPYHLPDLELFSPPQGNFYFVEKLLDKLNWAQLYTNHLVAGVKKEKKGYQTTILDIANQRRLIVNSEHIIYAGKKHALKFIYPQASVNYFDVRYAPWVTINFILDNQYERQGVWQNEWLGKHDGYMGFVDSDAQFHDQYPKRIFTAYYCLLPEERINLQSNEFLTNLTYQTLDTINQFFQVNLDALVEKAIVKPMGHAMAIPATGFLTKARFEEKSFKMAGCDNGRLPLLFEALDSGILAAQKINKL